MNTENNVCSVERYNGINSIIFLTLNVLFRGKIRLNFIRGPLGFTGCFRYFPEIIALDHILGVN